MGHYASEMSGPGLSKEDGLRIVDEEREGLAGHWQIGLTLIAAYPFSRKEYTCPQCLARVQSTFLRHHDEWHASLVGQMTEIARWTMPGRIG